MWARLAIGAGCSVQLEGVLHLEWRAWGPVQGVRISHPLQAALDIYAYIRVIRERQDIESGPSMGCGTSTASSEAASKTIHNDTGGDEEVLEPGAAPQARAEPMSLLSNVAHPPIDADVINEQAYEQCTGGQIGHKLHEAAEAGDVRTLQLILATQKGQDNIDYQMITPWSDKFEEGSSGTSLMSAIAAGREDASRFLASKVSDINLEVDGMSALTVSIMYRKERIMRMLVEEFNADVSITDPSPLLVAITTGNEAAANFLIDHKAEIDMMSESFSTTALGLAALLGFQSFARLLMSRGADKGKALSGGENLGPAQIAIIHSFFDDMRRLDDLRNTLEAEREALEADVASSIKSVGAEALPTTAKGITVRGLKKVAEKVKQLVIEGFFAQEKKYDDGTICPAVTEYDELTTTHVVYCWVKNSTGDKRLADYFMGDLINPTDVGIPNYFISREYSSFPTSMPSLRNFLNHSDAWKGGFAKLVSEVLGYCEGKGLSDETCVW